jgi:hypothetical protein
MKAVVQRVASDAPDALEVTEIDISNDPALEAEFGVEIPVLMVDGKKAAKYRLSEPDLRAILRARARIGG